MNQIKSEIAMFLIKIAFKIIPTDELEDIYATLIHGNLQREQWNK